MSESGGKITQVRGNIIRKRRKVEAYKKIAPYTCMMREEIKKK